jgi:hypothetical protein
LFEERDANEHRKASTLRMICTQAGILREEFLKANENMTSVILVRCSLLLGKKRESFYSRWGSSKHLHAIRNTYRGNE